MIIEDFVMLGRAVPEMSKRHGLVTCAAGYSEELRGFVRIYPMTRETRMHRWDICKIHVERPNHDNRDESFRLKTDRPILMEGKASKDQEFDKLEKLAARSIASLNQNRQSLAIIKPKNIAYRFSEMKPNEEFLMQLDFLEDQKPAEMPRPRIIFDDEDGRHDIQLRDWGSTAFIGKGNERHKLWSALKLDDPGYEHLFFCGNHNIHRNNWLVISVISRKIPYCVDLFSET